MEYQTPCVTTFHNRKRFHATQKSLSESISEWFKRLQTIVNNCEFKQFADFMLMDKFMSGLSETDFEKISKVPIWTVDELILMVIGNAHTSASKEPINTPESKEDVPFQGTSFDETGKTQRQESDILQVKVENAVEIDDMDYEFSDSFEDKFNERTETQTEANGCKKFKADRTKKTKGANNRKLRGKYCEGARESHDPFPPQQLQPQSTQEHMRQSTEEVPMHSAKPTSMLVAPKIEPESDSEANSMRSEYEVEFVMDCDNSRNGVLPDYQSPSNSALSLQNERRQRSDKKWVKEKTYSSEEDALLDIKNENCWSRHSTNHSYGGRSIIYRCNKVKAKGHQCSSGVYLLYHADSENITLFRSENAHDCHELPPRGKQGVSPDVVEFISKCLDSKMRCKEIMNAIYLKGMVVPSKSQMNYCISTLRKNRNDPPKISIAELKQFLTQHLEYPENPNEAFVLDYRISDENEKRFDFFVTSKKLLSLAIGKKLFACDTSSKVIWQGFPVTPVGTLDMDRNYHMFGLGVSSDEHSDAFDFFFRAIKNGVNRVHGIDIKPEILLSDASKSIQSGFTSAFGDDCLILMCWHHMKKALRDQLSNLIPTLFHDNVMTDVDTLQICQNPEMFERASTLFLQKYCEFGDFVSYFQEQWLKQNRNWYEGASPMFVPSSNNGEETFTRWFKEKKTMRDRLPLQLFTEKLFVWIVSFGVEYDSGARGPFIEEPTISPSLWTQSHEWERLNKFDREETNSLILVPAGDAVRLDVSRTDKWESFDDFKNRAFQVWQVDTSENDWIKWTCSCPAFKKKYICKHVIGIAINLQKVKPPISAEANPIGGNKRKRGRPPKAEKALLV
ncbi:hypothetical protein Bhyg_04844 [Pseudolycoriella hygida]|uniref:SWIM-type domain-containing protein n=1 Tax=Pseudolycoriella hygida TaxID=35572 RepID=A0A9Q0NHE0_9DIPT|nr:hypothetical protein Bhyg_04844 [Pseudolycoriella hygida]